MYLTTNVIIKLIYTSNKDNVLYIKACILHKFLRYRFNSSTLISYSLDECISYAIN